MNCSTPGFLVLHYLLEFAQTTSTDSEMPFNHPYMTTGKTSALTIWTFVGKVISLLFNTLSRFIIAFLSKSKHLHFMAAVTVCSDFGAQKKKTKSDTVSTVSPAISHEVMGPDAMIFVF